ncbi:MAG: carboxypeptidase-like regulatory domain-containing protein, partial [Cyclobacteriaceae bacterium]|nr:carboxypeptidase-like regulatory domain-containing protein [Cyclobacteriaceae bacterium]
MKKGKIFVLVMMLGINMAIAQTQITGTIKGQITEKATGAPLPYATLKIDGTDPVIGAVTDMNGMFSIEGVPVGRFTVNISSMGFEPVLIRELLVTSGKDVVLNVQLTESYTELQDVVVTPEVNKSQPVNNLAGINARMLSVEEANRYAGGFDDPARLASSFAGVSSGIQSNGIVVRGNNPGSLLWRMEGVEISNPNHFADLGSFGGGALTALSSQMLANSDFLTGAFPAAYSNAISGVFDLSMRSGNNDKREYTLQAGITGVDVSSEGPLSGNSSASYLFNYRYSALGLLAPILPEEAGGTNYQDLAFKFKVPTKSSGLFSFWGIGLIDNSGQSIEEDLTQWKYESDQLGQDAKQYMGSSGIKHTVYVGKSSFLESDIALTSNGLDLATDKMIDTGEVNPDQRIKNGNWDLVAQTKFNSFLEKGHIMEFGMRSYFQNYNLYLQRQENGTFRTLIDDKGSSILGSVYGLAQLALSEWWTLQGGLNVQHFSLNGQTLAEPRASLEWKPGNSSGFGIAYGLHSRTERPNYYLNRDVNGIRQNRNLKMLRSHHFVAT